MISDQHKDSACAYKLAKAMLLICENAGANKTHLIEALNIMSSLQMEDAENYPGSMTLAEFRVTPVLVIK